MLTETERHELQELLRDAEDEENEDTDGDYKTIDEAIKEIFCEKSDLFAGGMMDLSYIIGYFEDKTQLKHENLLSVFNAARSIPFNPKAIQLHVDSECTRVCGVWITHTNYLIAKYLLGENITIHYSGKNNPIFFTDEKRLVVIAPRIDRDDKIEQPLDNYMLYLFSNLFLHDANPTVALKILNEITNFNISWHVKWAMIKAYNTSLEVRN